jgi:hypothetical protein
VMTNQCIDVNTNAVSKSRRQWNSYFFFKSTFPFEGVKSLNVSEKKDQKKKVMRTNE